MQHLHKKSCAKCLYLQNKGPQSTDSDCFNLEVSQFSNGPTHSDEHAHACNPSYTAFTVSSCLGVLTRHLGFSNRVQMHALQGPNGMKSKSTCNNKRSGMRNEWRKWKISTSHVSMRYTTKTHAVVPFSWSPSLKSRFKDFGSRGHPPPPPPHLRLDGEALFLGEP